MIRIEEERNPDSCFNRASLDEPVFVLLGRDVASVHAIMSWMMARVAAGKNKPCDQQLLEAMSLCDAIVAYQQLRNKNPEPTGKPDGEQHPAF